MTTFALRLSPISPAAPLFSLLFSCPKWLVLFPVIYPKGSYFTDFIRQWSVVEVAGRQLFHVSLRIYLFFLSSSGFWSNRLFGCHRARQKEVTLGETKKRDCSASLCVCVVLLCVRSTHTGTGAVRRRIALGGFVDFGSSLEYISHRLTLCRDQSGRGKRRRRVFRGLYLCVSCVILVAFRPHVPLLPLLSLAECFCTTCRCATRHGGEFFFVFAFLQWNRKDDVWYRPARTRTQCPVPSLIVLLYPVDIPDACFYSCKEFEIWCVGRWGRGAGLQVC